MWQYWKFNLLMGLPTSNNSTFTIWVCTRNAMLCTMYWHAIMLLSDACKIYEKKVMCFKERYQEREFWTNFGDVITEKKWPHD